MLPTSSARLTLRLSQSDLGLRRVYNSGESSFARVTSRPSSSRHWGRFCFELNQDTGQGR